MKKTSGNTYHIAAVPLAEDPRGWALCRETSSSSKEIRFWWYECPDDNVQGPWTKWKKQKKTVSASLDAFYMFDVKVEARGMLSEDTLDEMEKVMILDQKHKKRTAKYCDYCHYCDQE